MSSTTTSLTGAQRTIVVVEDEVAMAEAVALRLRSEGFTVAVAHDGPSGVLLCERLAPDLVVVDLNLPGFDGLEVCRRVQRERHVPVVMLTARDGETDLIVGLAVGADDYVTKPFSPRELVARIHAVLRRVTAAENEAPLRLPPSLVHGDITLDPSRREASRDGELLHLTATEFDLARWFLSHPKVVFTREQLLRSVWGYPDGSGERTVDSHVQAVRKKLGPDFIRTVHGVGYGLGPASISAQTINAVDADATTSTTVT
jgi:DNA-binding response OmpR family regulator